MNVSLLPNEKIGLALITAVFWGFGIYIHFVAPSEGLNSVVLPLLLKLDFAIFVAPFSAYMFVMAKKRVEANISVTESMKGILFAIAGVGLIVGAIYLRNWLNGESGG